MAILQGKEYEAAIRQKRVQTLLGIWNSLVENGKFSASRFRLSTPLVNETIEYYLSDLESLKRRYKIEESRVQLHKIAGMMAGAIMRFRPVIPQFNEIETEYDLVANEVLAVFHGIAICGEYNLTNGQLQIINEPWFDPWLKDFLYVLHYRHYTSEALIFVFETLSYLRFPKNMGPVGD